MTYYKIIDNGQIIDVNNEFFRFQKTHLNAVRCEPERAEAVRSSDGEVFYTDNWLKPLPKRVSIKHAEVYLITEEEYNSLKEQLATSETVVAAPVEIKNVVENKPVPATEVDFAPVEQVVSIRDLYEEIKRLKEELNSIKK